MIGAFVSFCAVVVGLIITAQHRKPGVTLLSAIASRNVIFRPELYDDEGQRWARVHRWGIVGIPISILIGGIASLCLESLARLGEGKSARNRIRSGQRPSIPRRAAVSEEKCRILTTVVDER